MERIHDNVPGTNLTREQLRQFIDGQILVAEFARGLRQTIDPRLGEITPRRYGVEAIVIAQSLRKRREAGLSRRAIISSGL